MLVVASGLMHAQVTPQQGLQLPDFRAHDPWILADKATHRYYLYTSSGVSSGANHRSGVGVYESEDLKTWSGPHVVFQVPEGSWANPSAGIWAPEVHFYQGKYFLFATLNNYDKKIEQPARPSQNSNVTKIEVTYNGIGPHLRGTQVFVSDSPEGPFKTIVDRPIAPADYMSLDGTLYFEDDIPYMVYAHEWTQLVDGAMEAIQMKPDFSGSVGDPIYLFKASDAPWLKDRTTTANTPQNYVTDGPELFRTRGGKLLMIWSSYQHGQYVETLAHSESGKFKGPWKQDHILVGEDSGHGMLFRTFAGKLMLVLHQPFNARLARAKLFEIEDTGDTIRLKDDPSTPTTTTPRR
jgi:beta-xylosidase